MLQELREEVAQTIRNPSSRMAAEVVVSLTLLASSFDPEFQAATISDELRIASLLFGASLLGDCLYYMKDKIPKN